MRRLIFAMVALLPLACANAADWQPPGPRQCPSECIRAYECALFCGGPDWNNGCCECPAGTVEMSACPRAR